MEAGVYSTPASVEVAGNQFIVICGPIVPVGDLPPELWRYTLPSRYCDADELLDFAWKQFGQIPHGIQRVQAICDWVHNNMEYRFGSGRPDLSASEVIARRHGVCRDFARAAIALCRTFNLPARYVTGHLPDIGFDDPGSPMDCHAYCEIYLGQDWLTLDPRFNVPRHLFYQKPVDLDLLPPFPLQTSVYRGLSFCRPGQHSTRRIHLDGETKLRTDKSREAHSVRRTHGDGGKVAASASSNSSVRPVAAFVRRGSQFKRSPHVSIWSLQLSSPRSRLAAMVEAPPRHALLIVPEMDQFMERSSGASART